MQFFRRFLYIVAVLAATTEQANAQSLAGILEFLQTLITSPLFATIACPILSNFGLSLALCGEDGGDDDDDEGPSPVASPVKAPKKVAEATVASPPVAVPTAAAAPAL